MSAEPVLAGLFVGGASRRMGGSPKGLLPAPDGSGTLIERLVRVARGAGLRPVLVGRNAAVEAALPALDCVDDRPGGSGPIAGVAALLRCGSRRAIVLSCDLPAVSAAALRRLAGAAPEAAIVAPRDDAGRWQPFFSRWDASALPLVEAAIAAGERSMQPLLDRHAVQLPLSPGEWHELRDWDTPGDVAAG